jgi:DNA-binding MarR family transcriptional regulator/GNAT superfamily N-acetyltransferase
MNVAAAPAAVPAGPDEVVRTIRAFNRDYTRLIGALDYEHRLGTPHSLPEARVLYELAQRERTAVTALRQDLDMDPGQLSRLLARLAEQRLIARERDAHDTRRQLVRLTSCGRAAAELLDTRSREAIGTLVGGLLPREVERLLVALRTVRRLLGGGATSGEYTLRPPGPGDLGWVIERHGALYAEQYGWNSRFETLVAEVVAEYARTRDPAREAAWIAWMDGERVGSVFCVGEDGGGAAGDVSGDVAASAVDDVADGVADSAANDVADGATDGAVSGVGGGGATARLRLLLVEPHARGRGIGAHLVSTCLAFARAVGYTRMVLWTNDVLTSARPLYEQAGFHLDSEHPHTMFGPPVRGQNWSLPL